MAQEVRSFTVTVPAGTAQAAPLVASLTMPPRIVVSLHVRVPPGPRGELGFAVGAAGVAILPAQTGAWIVAEDEVIDWPLELPLSSGAWQLFAYNTGQFAHTLQVRFLLDLLQTAPAGAAGGSLDLTGLSGAVLTGGGDLGGVLPTPQPLPELPPLTPPVDLPPLPTLPPLPPLPTLPPITLPPLPPITLPPLPGLSGPGTPAGPPTYAQALEAFFAAQLIAMLVFGRGVGAATVNQIAADVQQLGEQRALNKWATVALQQGEIYLLDRVQNLRSDWQHPAQHTHSAAQVT